MEIYQTSYFKSDIKFKCKECGAENEYRLDFGKIIKRLDAVELEDQIFTVEHEGRIYNFTINYPLV